MENRNVPFGLAIGLIVLVAGIALAGVYCQSVSFSSGNPAVMPVVKSQVPSEKMATTKTFRNDAYGLEFSYSPEWGNVDIDIEEGNPNYVSLSNNGDQIFYLLTEENITLTKENPKRDEGDSDFYDIPKGTIVDDWIIKKQGEAYQDEGDGYFSNKIGQTFDVAGPKTLHLVHRKKPELGTQNAFDEFYFVKDGRLFILAIVNNPSMREELKLDDDFQWYTQLLKSFKVVDAR
jgi:hypothetical protein